MSIVSIWKKYTIHAYVTNNHYVRHDLFCEDLSYIPINIFMNTQIDNNGINANFVFPYFYSLLPYFDHMMLVNVNLNVSGYKGITFQG